MINLERKNPELKEKVSKAYTITGFFVLLNFLVLCVGCGQTIDETNNGQKLLILLSPEESGIHFKNTIDNTAKFFYAPNVYYRGGAGVATGDINNDGLADICFTGNLVENKLYLNKGNLHFEDITEKANVSGDNQSWSKGVVMADINNDGFLDIYICNTQFDNRPSGANLLYINNGDLTFSEKAQEFGLNGSGNSLQASFFDFDRDGDLDMYLINHIDQFMGSQISPGKIPFLKGCFSDKLYMNNGNGTFTDISQKAGIDNCALALNVLTADFNNDGWPDIFITNDFLMPDKYYLNNGDGTFTESTKMHFGHYSHTSMGSDAADFNNDGLIDLFTLDMLPEDNVRQRAFGGMIDPKLFEMMTNAGVHYQYIRNCLFLNNGKGFSEIGQMAQVDKTDWSWSCLFADLDNDGLKDIFVTNSAMFNWAALENELGTSPNIQAAINAGLENAIENYAFKNNGDLTFTKATKLWGIDQKVNSTGMAIADLDNDGDLDLVLNNLNETSYIYENKATDINKNNYFNIKLLKAKNNYDYGAKVTIYHNGWLQFQELINSRGYLSSSENVLHFGLKNMLQIDSLEVKWPGGKTQKQYKIKANQTLSIYPDKDQVHTSPTNQNITLFDELSVEEMGLTYKHRENDFFDFYPEILLPHKFSQEGPGIAVGDVNGDKLEDVFIGGASEQAGALYMQTEHSKFILSENKCWKDDSKYEDMGVLLFDCDNDGDLDLYVVSGGYEFDAGSQYYQDRLYINDGKGNFKKSLNLLPSLLSSGSCVVAGDYDKDGDLDLFVGGRVIPRKYPYPPESYLLENKGGKFIDVTDKLAPSVRNAGMITSALWSDFDNDDDLDLIVLGEWTPVMFYENVNGNFENITSMLGIDKYTGWWNSITGADFDKDGDIDYIVGNLGQNSKYKASFKNPISVYCNDFDENGSLDIVLTHYVDEVNVPVRGSICSSTQMPGLQQHIPPDKLFGELSVFGIYREEMLAKSMHYDATYFNSAYIENKGDLKFVFKPLPEITQIAPVYSMLVNDYDSDGNLDILMVGNSYAPEVETGRYDAFYGMFLKGDGKGDFYPVAINKSGFYMQGDAKGLAEIKTGGHSTLILITNNNDALKAFKVNGFNK